MDTEEVKEPFDAPSATLRLRSGQEFNVGDKVRLGNGTPGRVICNDALNIHQMCVLALIQHRDGINEMTYMFSKYGLCLLALNRGENESHYEESNLYLDGTSTPLSERNEPG